MRFPVFFYSPDGGGGSGGSAGSGSGQAGAGGSGNGAGAGDGQDQGQGLTYDAWIAGQDESVKTLLNGHLSGLKSSLSSERDARSKVEKQLKELALKAEKGSELEQKLNNLVAEQQKAQSQAEFYELAHAAGIKNLKLAFMVASNDELIDGRGRVNFDEMKRRYPELFGTGQSGAAGNAGAGTGNNGQAGARSMNDFIRTAAGRK